MRIAVVGAGAMGGSYGGMLAVAGEDVGLLDARSDHVAAIRAGGLRVSGAFGEHVVRLPAAESPEGLEPAEGAWADLVIVFTDTNATRDAARAADHLLAPEGCAITFQNGIGNIETLQRGARGHCARARRLQHVQRPRRGARPRGDDPPRPDLHRRARRTAHRTVFERVVGMPSSGPASRLIVQDDIHARIWTKFIVNSAVNALCATTGLRVGEVGRLAEMDALQDRVLDEAFALVRAKEVRVRGGGSAGRNQAELPPQVQPALDAPARGSPAGGPRSTRSTARSSASRTSSASPPPTTRPSPRSSRDASRTPSAAERSPALDYDAWEAEVAAEEERQAGA